jgi:hypothetical protein
MTQGGYMNRNIKKIISLIFSFCFVIVSLQFLSFSYSKVNAYVTMFKPEHVQVYVEDIAQVSEFRQLAIHQMVAFGFGSGCEILEDSDQVYRVNFCPDRLVKRADIGGVLRSVRAYTTSLISDRVYDDPVDQDTTGGVSDQGTKFKDISKLTEIQQRSINWLTNAKVTKGCNKNGDKFCPDNILTRGAAAELMFKLTTGTKGYQDYSPNFKDIGKLSRARIRAINWMKDAGISEGCNKDGTKYCPSKPVTWGAMSEFTSALKSAWQSPYWNKNCEGCKNQD